MNSKPLKNLINKAATFRGQKPSKRPTVLPNVNPNDTTTSDLTDTNNENLNTTTSQNDMTSLSDTTINNETIIYNGATASGTSSHGNERR